MIPCCCVLPVCGRETGRIPTKSRAILCRAKIVVPRHEPTLPPIMGRWPWGFEPIEDEQ